MSFSEEASGGAPPATSFIQDEKSTEGSDPVSDLAAGKDVGGESDQGDGGRHSDSEEMDSSSHARATGADAIAWSGSTTVAETGDLQLPDLPRKRNRTAETHNSTERKRREKIKSKLQELRRLVPNSDKTDLASMLDNAISYTKSLQHQVRAMAGLCHTQFCPRPPTIQCLPLPRFPSRLIPNMVSAGYRLPAGSDVQHATNMPVFPSPGAFPSPAESSNQTIISQIHGSTENYQQIPSIMQEEDMDKKDQ